MTREEILREFNYRYINTKNNNYIFTGVKDFSIVDEISDICSITLPDSFLDIDYAYNIKIDLNQVEVREILAYTLSILRKMKALDVTLEYPLDFKTKFDVLRFQHILTNYNKAVQLVFYNIENLSLEDQMLFNEIYYFHSFLYNVNTFTKEGNFKSYFLTGDRVLDNRENYTKVKVIRH